MDLGIVYEFPSRGFQGIVDENDLDKKLCSTPDYSYSTTPICSNWDSSNTLPKKKEKEKKSAVKIVQPPTLPKSSTLKISEESSEVLEAIEKAGSSMDLEPGLDDLVKANKFNSKTKSKGR